MSVYQDDFYIDLHKRTLYPAETISEILLGVLPEVRSAVDVGCAVGSWLSVLRKKGVGDILGIDGDWVNTDFLEIPKECFKPCDLSKPFTVEKKYDLGMSLEVAEHLPGTSAGDFVQSLVAMSDFILFSAAIPFQGGTNHVNEQWLEYWNNLFGAHHYKGVDIIRRKIWNDAKIPFWYKQNLILYVQEKRMKDLRLNSGVEDYQPLSLVHPEQYLSAKVAWRIVADSLKRKITNLF